MTSRIQIEATARRLLTFKRRTSTHDADGNATVSFTTLGTAYGDIQPQGSTIREGGTTSLEAQGAYTHFGFEEERGAFTLKAKDVVSDAMSSLTYEIQMVHDFNITDPREFDLRLVTDAD